MPSIRKFLPFLILAAVTLAGCGSDGGTGPAAGDDPPPPPERLEFQQVSRDPLSSDLLAVTGRDGIGLAISRDGLVAIRKAKAGEWFTPDRFADDRMQAAHVTADGALLATTSDRIFRAPEPGGNWSMVFERNLGGFFSIASEAQTVIAVGRGIYRSADGGKQWARVADFPIDVFDHVASLGSKVFLALNSVGELYRSEDDGQTWQFLEANPPVGFFTAAMAFADDQHGIAVRANTPATILVTDTGGKSWEEVTGVGQIRDLSVLPSGFVVVLRANAQLHVSSNGGRTFSGAFESDRALLAQPEAVHAISETNWLLVGPSGVIIETVDGGSSWQPRTRGLATDFCELAVSGDGVLVGIVGRCEFSSFASGLAISTDAGFSFNVLDAITGNAEPSRVVLRGNRGVVVGDAGMIATSEDGGQTWSAARQISTANLTDLALVDDTTLVVVAGDGGILRSTDGGASFQEVFSTGSFNRRVLHFPGSSTLLVSGSVTMRSTDLGDTWSVVNLQGIDPPREWAAPNATTGFGISGQSDLVRTDDGGASWRPVVTLADAELLRIVFAGPLHGLALTSKGILQTLDGGETWEGQEIGTGLPLTSLALDADGGAWIGGINGQLFEGFSR